MNKLLMIYNPNSGKKNITAHLDRIIEIFAAEGKLLTLYRIGENRGADLKKIIGSGEYEGVIVCGGDGSVNTTAQIILESGLDIPMGIIPNGTCNDFSRSLGMPNDLLRCARLVAQGNVMKTDIGIINGGKSVFVNELAGGMLVSVSFNTDQNLKKMFGPLAYYVNGIGELTSMKPFDITIETEDSVYNEKALVFVVLNGTDMSGFSNVIKEAHMQDGYMDILIFKNTKPLEMTDTLIKFVTGGDFRDENVVRIKTQKCKITCPASISTTVDGEKGPLFPLELEMKKEAISVYY